MKIKHLLLCSFIIAGMLGLTIITAMFLFFSEVTAAPASTEANTLSIQPPAAARSYVSVSGLAFEPTRPNVPYTKDIQRQLLTLTSQSPGNNSFIASLHLPDRSELLGMTVFGDDFDFQGEIRVRLKRCDHGQPRCVTLAETNSTLGYAAGQFETAQVNLLNEIVDNRLYTYFLELELTALANSGLRSARIELVPPGTGGPGTPPGGQGQWALTGDVRSFPVPTSGLAQVRICANDLSHLNNPTHFPYIVLDQGNTILLGSNSCEIVWGSNIEIQRRPNTGPSSGTYQILR